LSPAIRPQGAPDYPADAASLDQAVLGGGPPDLAERHLRLAARGYHDEAVAEAHLRMAEAAAPDHVAVLIAFYRFYFYKNRLADALNIACRCLLKGAEDNGLPVNWRAVEPGDAAFSDFGAALPRFYLFTLKAFAYLNLRLGNLDEGRAALAKLLELDPSDKVGANVLMGVVSRMGADDDG
jgi:hypothetical protein